MASETRVGRVTRVVSASEVEVVIASDPTPVVVRQQAHVNAFLGSVVTVRVEGALMFVDGKF